MADSFKTIGKSGGTDENGLSRITVPWYVDSIDQVWSVGRDAVEGLPAMSRTFTQLGNGHFKVNVTHEGYSDDDKEEGNTGEEATTTWNVDFDFSEEPIEAHHNLEEIKKRYGGTVVEGKVEFPEKLPTNSRSRSGLRTSSNGSNDKNPLFGVETYILLKARISKRYTTEEIPADVSRTMGRIIRTIPNAPEDLASMDWGDRDWMIQPPKVEFKGEVRVITQEYLLSPPGGWPEGVHEFIER
ncbi:MAG: hypothetical protein GY872_07475 [Roseibacillus sp.]|nr:hypothetical protein [Myxococcales bacterium]MCP4729902.1 hypothetical protein [Roseibacillus sp.]